MTISTSFLDAQGNVHHGSEAFTPHGSGYQHLTVYRSATLSDRTNGGVSSIHDTLVLVGWVDRRKGARGERVVNPLPLRMRGPWGLTADEATAAVALEVTDFSFGRRVRLVPVTWTEGDWKPVRGAMFGGNFADGDVRLSELIHAVAGPTLGNGVVDIHDRIER